MALYEDFVDITIGGVDVSDYVVDYRRNESICEPGATFVLTMTRKKFDDSMLTISTAAEVDIKEKYPSEDRVLKGYVTSVDVNANDINMRVTGGDKYILLHDYFIDHRLETNGESVAYWISYICGLVGLSVQFDTYPGIATQVAEDGGGGTPLGMQRATEAIKLLERKGAVYTRYDSDQDKIVVYALATSQPKVNITSDNITSFDRTEGTEFTRNVVKVWGGHHYDWLTGQEHQYLAVARKNMDELVVDQTSYIASPEIQTQMFASIIASRILTITATLDDLVIAECAGLYPDVKITDFASISINVDGIGQSADRQITSLGVAVDDNGAKTTFVFGEKCPRVTFSPPPFYVYATSYSGGAAISYDAGDSFYTFNEGLPASGGTYDCVSIAANTYNQLMMVANQGKDIYKRPGVYGTWTRVTVTDPSNDEGEYYFTASEITYTKVEKETGYYNKFHLLANATTSGTGGIVPSGQERWWVYWTGDFGYTWDSMQLYVPGSGTKAIGTASGLPEALIDGTGITHADVLIAATASGSVLWNVTARDIEGDKLGNITLIVDGQVGVYTPPDTVAAETFYTSTVAYAGGDYLFRGSTWWMDGQEDFQEWNKSNWIIGETIKSNSFYLIRLFGGNAGNHGVFSVPNNREVAYVFAEQTSPAGSGAIIGRTTGEYRENYGYQDVPVWDWIQSAAFDVSPEQDSAGLQGWSILLDYSSLKAGSDIVRFCMIGAKVNAGGGGDNYPGDCTIDINCYFFEDDITIPADEDSCSVTNDNRVIGVASYGGSPLSYTGEGTYGWTKQDSTTVSPTPRGWLVVQPHPQGSSPAAVTTSLTGGNTGHWCIIVLDTGSKHGDDRDAGWPEEQHPRDWGEQGAVGIYTVKVDFDSKTISNISLVQYWPPNFHDPPPDVNQPQRDTDIADWAYQQSPQCTFIQPNLFSFYENWDDHGGLYQHLITYPGFARGQNVNWENFRTDPTHQYSSPLRQWAGVRKIPFYNTSPIAYTAYGRELVPASEYIGPIDSRVLNKNYIEGSIIEPPTTPSGMNQFYRGHPDFGYCVTERRAAVNNPLTHDHIFMWKAQRASSTEFEEMGNSSHYSDPYAQTSYGITYPLSWDFRTKAGTIMHSGGGASTNWNWLSG
jgi:hypothetical protein